MKRSVAQRSYFPVSKIRLLHGSGSIHSANDMFVFGVRADKTRSLEFEEPFFHALGRYFRVQPLLVQLEKNKEVAGQVEPQLNQSNDRSEWSVHGVGDETYTYICHRWASTLASGWEIPATDSALMYGASKAGDSGGTALLASEKHAQDRTWGWVENQLAAIEWD